MFCREYLIDLIAIQAAIRTRYSEKTARASGNENLTKPDIQDRIAELEADRNYQVKIDAPYVLRRLVQIDQMDVLGILRDYAGIKAVSGCLKVWHTTLSGMDVAEMVNDAADLLKNTTWRITGEIVQCKWVSVYKEVAIPEAEIISRAQSLITHGIIGKAKVRQLQRHESCQGATEFNVSEYISAARNHLAMNAAEAEPFPMTEFALMLAQKFPDQIVLTYEEYDQMADDYLACKMWRAV